MEEQKLTIRDLPPEMVKAILDSMVSDNSKYNVSPYQILAKFVYKLWRDLIECKKL